MATTEFKIGKPNPKRFGTVEREEQMVQVAPTKRGGKRKYKLIQRTVFSSGAVKQRLAGSGVYQKGMHPADPGVWFPAKGSGAGGDRKSPQNQADKAARQKAAEKAK